jgi:uncharacterized protein DUF1902
VAKWDPVARVWFAEHDEVLLDTEAPTIEALNAKFIDMVRDVLVAQGRCHNQRSRCRKVLGGMGSRELRKGMPRPNLQWSRAIAVPQSTESYRS